MDLRAELLPVLEAGRLPGLDAGPGAIYPAYAGYSLCNLPASACRWLGVPAFGAPPLADAIHSRLERTFRHVILVLVDGLGLGQLEQVLAEEKQSGQEPFWSELCAEALFAPLTSITPSTTSSALTTLWTGAAPAAHGVMGYEMWLKEYSMIINAISHSPVTFSGDPGSLRRAGFQPETFLPVATLAPHLNRNGVRVFSYQHKSIAHSGLSTMLFPGTNSVPYRSLSDLWVTLESQLESAAGERTYSFVYWSELDELSHRFGPGDERVGLELGSFSRLFARFLARQRAHRTGDTLLLVTADHGLLHTPRSPAYELANHPRLLSCLTMLPSGENRLPYLYLHPGREQELREYVQTTWPGEFRLFPSDQVITSGLFGNGEVYRRTPERTGDLVAFPQGQAYWWWADKENPMLGRHGGLSREEMLVPLLALPL